MCLSVFLISIGPRSIGLSRKEFRSSMFKVQFLYAQILLILFSSFPKDVTLPPNPKLTGMVNATELRDEIIMTGFGDTQTAYLARAALARLQRELGMATDDVAMVLREAEGSVAVQQVLHRDTGRNESSTFWGTLADLFFTAGSSAGTAAETVSEKCATFGIDPTFTSRIVNQFRLCESALLVRTRGLSQREKVIGVLRGFDGELARVPVETKYIN